MYESQIERVRDEFVGKDLRIDTFWCVCARERERGFWEMASSKGKSLVGLGFRTHQLLIGAPCRSISSTSASQLYRYIQPNGLSGVQHQSLVSSWAMSGRGFRSGRDDPSFRYEMAPPTNWGVRIVPEKSAFVIERFGKYLKTLGSGKPSESPSILL